MIVLLIWLVVDIVIYYLPVIVLVVTIYAFCIGRKEWQSKKNDDLAKVRKISFINMLPSEVLDWKKCRDRGIPATEFRYWEYWTSDNIKEKMHILCSKEIEGIRENRKPFRIGISNLDDLIKESA